jgi:hypothetical protein
VQCIQSCKADKPPTRRTCYKTTSQVTDKEHEVKAYFSGIESLILQTLSMCYTLPVRLSAGVSRSSPTFCWSLRVTKYRQTPTKMPPIGWKLVLCRLQARKLKAKARNGRWNGNSLLWSRRSVAHFEVLRTGLLAEARCTVVKPSARSMVGIMVVIPAPTSTPTSAAGLRWNTPTNCCKLLT